MSQRTIVFPAVGGLLLVCITMSLFAQQAAQTPAAAPYVPEDHRPPLFFKDTFRHPGPLGLNAVLGQDAISVPNVELKIYGQTKQSPPGPHDATSPNHGGLELVHRATPKDDPTFIYFGPCFTPCAVAFRDRNNFVDLTGLAKIKWRTKQAGFHALQPIVKLANGTWLVGDYREPAASDWNEREFAIMDVRWHLFNAERVVTTQNADWVEKPDLSRVDEFGFADLMPGNAADQGHGTASTARVDWIEIWGSPVKR